ncbi:MAG: type II secretion system F family protein [Candidatus Micrarchaeia archaeon]
MKKGFFTLVCKSANFDFFEKTRVKERALDVEASLPVALRSLSVHLDIGTPFEKSLETIVQDNKDALSKEFKRVLSDVDAGLDVPSSLRSAAKRVDSVSFKRACMHLSFSYSHGGSAQGLRKLADELSSVQRQRVKEFSAKAALLGLLFVTAGCLLPTFFSAYALVGSLFLGSSTSVQDVFVAFVVVFPLVDAAVLYYVLKKAPKTVLK